jgi:hypothetical protein
MSDIFISYASADRSNAKRFADSLESLGWSVWWDREIPIGKNFDGVIEEELNAAKCVIVLWSKESVRSRWVRTEASSAASRSVLVPVLIDAVPVPLEFTLIQAAQLANWDGDPAHPEYQRLLSAVQELVRTPRKTEPVLPHRPRANSSRTLAIVIIAAVILGVLIWSRTSGRVPSAVEDRSGSTATTNQPPATRNVSDAIDVRNAMSIKVGDRISDGIPAPGAGIIESPHSEDAYVFPATKGQRVYFHVTRFSNGMDQIVWKLVDPSGVEVFNTCLACTDPGLQVLSRDGMYSMVLGSATSTATGSYQLQLFNVPPPNQFPIRIGDRIADGIPGPGAGSIEVPGAEDVYTFTAMARQKIFIHVSDLSTGMDQIKLNLSEDDGMEIYDSCLACSDPGVQTLIKGGKYQISVSNKTNPATGTYRLQLFNVPPPTQFSIRIGDRIRPGQPGPGAGMIESPGSEDVYLFNASAGQKVYFHVLEHGSGMDQIGWRLADDIGMELFNTCLACGAPSIQTLAKGGTYTLTIGHARNAATGTYSLEIGTK